MPSFIEDFVGFVLITTCVVICFGVLVFFCSVIVNAAMYEKEREKCFEREELVQFSFWKGCLVKVDGKWLPASNLRNDK